MPMRWSVRVNPVNGSLLVCLLMVLNGLRLGAVEEFFCTGYYIQEAVSNPDKSARLDRRLIPQDAVLGDAHAVQAGPKRAPSQRTLNLSSSNALTSAGVVLESSISPRALAAVFATR
jgi:hypothetical protein